MQRKQPGRSSDKGDDFIKKPEFDELKMVSSWIHADKNESTFFGFHREMTAWVFPLRESSSHDADSKTPFRPFFSWKQVLTLTGASTQCQAQELLKCERMARALARPGFLKVNSFSSSSLPSFPFGKFLLSIGKRDAARNPRNRKC